MFNTNKLNAIPIIEVAERLGIEITKTKALCPWHDDTNPSLKFYTNTNKFICFVCFKKGNVITLVCEYLGFGFIDACKWLENNFGYTSHYIGRKTVPLKKRNTINKAKNATDISTINVVDSEVYQFLIESSGGLSNKGIKYFTEIRKFSYDLVKNLNIIDIETPAVLVNRLINNYGFDRINKSGLLNYRKSIWENYTIVFPFYNEQNQIVNLQGRMLPKTFRNLVNLPTSLWNRQILNDLNENSVVVICEGITDTMAALEIGFNAVGIIGVNGFKDEYIKPLSKYKLYLCGDSDEAGSAMNKQISQLLSNFGIRVGIINISSYNDLDDYRLNME